MTIPAGVRMHLLRPDDLLIMAQLCTMFGDAFTEVATYTAARPSAAYLERLLRSDCFLALAAIKDDEVVGGIAAYQLHKFEQERSEIYIYDLAVSPKHWRQGIGTALLRELEGIAAERGAYVMFVQADAADAPAIALYSQFGSREDVLHFDIAVRADRRPDDPTGNAMRRQ